MSGSAADPFRIEIVDQGNGWPVPLVDLEAVNGVKFVSDNAGFVAFDVPEMMGTTDDSPILIFEATFTQQCVA